ncbi:MAG TPA: cation transport regulator ChaB [Alphaproteobacteria bacterium]|nr:cation transport regulator ChaB [Alphaproteobacteria bacterium]
MNNTLRYQSNEELPSSVQQQLGPRLQSRYRMAYNQAWTEYTPGNEGEFNNIHVGTRAEYAHRKALEAAKPEKSEKAPS